MNVKFSDVVKACEYMDCENPREVAFQEGPIIGAARVAYVNAHKKHAQALELGDIAKIDSAWIEYCTAQADYLRAIYG
jgi:hypothetical protein